MVRFDGDRNFEALWEDDDRIFCRGHRLSVDGDGDTVLVVIPDTEHPTPASLVRLAHAYGLKDGLDAPWAVWPLGLVREGGRTVLVPEDPGSEPLGQLLGAPVEPGRLLHLAIGIAGALGKAHRRGFVHKDIKPADILLNHTSGEMRLTGSGSPHVCLRTAGTRSAGNDCRHTRLHGPRTNRAREPLDGRSWRSLRTR